MMAMILAAGKGERLRPITDKTPKSLVKVGGETLLERHFRMLIQAGITKVIINLGWLGNQIIDYVGSGEKFGIKVIYSPEENQILETGGGIVRALPMLGKEPFWVINADIYTDYELPIIDLKPNILGHLVLVKNPKYRLSGDFNLKDNLIQREGSLPYTFTGMAVYDPKLFSNQSIRRFSIVPLLFDQIDKKSLSGSLHNGSWHDIGTPERLKELNGHV